MSESWSEVGPQDEDTGQGSTAWSTNGKGVADAPESAAAPTGEADQATEGVAAAVAVGDPETDSTDDPQDVGAESVAAEPVAAGPVAAAVATAPIPGADPSTSFLGELARAMQATAGQERSRVVEDTERRRTVRVDEIRDRETAEAARMRELAAEDQASIDAWAEAEVERIKAEQQRRTEALEADLETSLGKHRELIAQEIERVESAIATYRTEVDAFFDTLEHETDPVAIAQIATRRPVFPSLDTVPLTADEPAEPADVEAAAPEEPALVAAPGIDAERTIEPDSFAYSGSSRSPRKRPQMAHHRKRRSLPRWSSPVAIRRRVNSPRRSHLQPPRRASRRSSV